MTKSSVRFMAFGAGLCLTAGLLSIPVVAQSTGAHAKPGQGAAGVDRMFDGVDVVEGNDPSVFHVVKVGDSLHPLTKEQIRREMAGGSDLPPALLEEKMRRAHPIAAKEMPTTKVVDPESIGNPPLGVVPPTNDSCSTPTVVTTGVTAFNNTCATAQGSDPTCVVTPVTTVWFQFTPSSTALYEVNTCGSSFDTVLSVHTAPSSCGPYTQQACDDDSGSSGPCPFTLQSRVQFCGTSGVPYYIMVTGFGGAFGAGSLTITNLGACPTPPANDNCSGATVLPGAGPFPISGTENNIDLATTEAADPLQSCSFGGASQDQHSVWFRWTPTSSFQVLADTCGSNFDTVLSAYTGTCGSFNEIACNDDGASPNCANTLQSGISWAATAGTTYYIEATQWVGATGAGLNMTFTLGMAPTPPANDACASPTILPPAGPFPITCNQSTSAATVDPNDPLQSCSAGGPAQGGATVWFQWTPSQSNAVLLNTCGSTYDTVAAVYTGTCGSFTEIACDDDSGAAGPCSFTLQSFLTFNAVAGVTYTIEIASYGGGAGGTLQKSLGPCVPSTCDSPAIDQDAWTTTAQCLADSAPGVGECGIPSAEVYTFPIDATPSGADPEDLVVVDQIKVPSCGLPNGVSVDYFFIRRNPLCPPGAPTTGEDICLPVQPSRRPRLILNDVFYPGTMFPPSTNGKPYQSEVALVFNSAHTRLGTGDYDFFKVVEFDPSVCPDVDGDLLPDCGVQLGSETHAGTRYNLSGTLDNYGAEVTEFFANRVRHNIQCLNVFEEHPNQPPARAQFPGNAVGEDALTRPWSFHVD
jgi:hypothetical protein